MRGTKRDINIDSLEIKDTGSIREIMKGIVKITGLPSCINGQLVQLHPDIKGLVLGFNEKEVLVLALGDDSRLTIGDTVYAEEGVFKIPVGYNFIGRVINSFGRPRDEKGTIKEDDFYPVFIEAPGVMERQPVVEPLETGIKIIDTCIPIGKGQRELILGDRVTGKTTIATDTILNQKGKDVICIFCWTGGSEVALRRIIDELREGGAMDYSVVINATASDSPAEQYVVPYAACALGEYFMHDGKDVLVVFDNLTKHAWNYRQISLLLQRPPGREAYPGDIFYIHSQLVERGAKMSDANGAGSMTLIPIVETQEGDVTGLVCSNIISMTDGQLYLDTKLFNQGFRPAIDLGLSVSRIGSKVQYNVIKEVSKTLKWEHAQYRELVSLTKVKTKLSEEVEHRLKRGMALDELLIQGRNNPLTVAEEAVLFYAFSKGFTQILDRESMKRFKKVLYKYLLSAEPKLIEAISSQKTLTTEIKSMLDKALERFFNTKWQS